MLGITASVESLAEERKMSFFEKTHPFATKQISTIHVSSYRTVHTYPTSKESTTSIINEDNSWVVSQNQNHSAFIALTSYIHITIPEDHDHHTIVPYISTNDRCLG